MEHFRKVSGKFPWEVKLGNFGNIPNWKLSMGITGIKWETNKTTKTTGSPQAQKSGFRLCALGSKVWSRTVEIICSCDGGMHSACRGRGLSMHSACRGHVQ